MPGAAADLLASALNQNVGGWRLSPAMTEIELHLGRWFAERLGFPDTGGGYITSGGAMASFVALKTARDARAGWSVRVEGMRAGPPLTMYASAQVHDVNTRAADMMGLGRGEFGGAAKDMTALHADRAVDLLVNGAELGARLNVAFLGGEPLVNRKVLQATTRRAAALAEAKGQTFTFSITTNGTLLTAQDAEFFEEFGFAVTISLDGPREVHDAQRSFKSGQGSFDRIVERLRPLFSAQRQMQVSARVTVTPGNIGLRETLDAFVALGFHSVGFSPLLSSPTGVGELQAHDLEVMLGEMIDCGREYERRVIAGERFPFANMVNAMKEIDRGTHRPYPCGAGAGYLGVSADGELSACHRFVDDEAGAMGSLLNGIDDARRAEWLAERHVHRQEPCRVCWARYMCGGGCHHEVIHRGRPACDYIRGWLHYCLEAYLRLAPYEPGVAPIVSAAHG